MNAETKITVEFSLDELQACAGLITAGAKSPHTGSEAIMTAAALLGKLQAAANQPKSNGRDEAAGAAPGS